MNKPACFIIYRNVFFIINLYGFFTLILPHIISNLARKKMLTEKKLFNEFSPVPTSVWEETIQKDLKGADYQKKLIWKNIEGIDVKPYYRSESLANLNHLNSQPGEFPFLRGNKTTNNTWFIAQAIDVADYKAANHEAHDLISKGVNSLIFRIPEELPSTNTFLAELLDSLPLEDIEVHFEAVGKAKEIIVELVENNSKLSGSVDFSPISRFMLKGKFCRDLHQIWKVGTEVLIASKVLKNFRIIRVKGELFHNSGSGIVQELAFSLAQGVEYLDTFIEQGIEAEKVAEKMRFSFAVGSNYFMEIAKFRAARYLWSKILDAHDVSGNVCASMHIHAVTSRWNKTVYDPYVNMLRTTTEAMSAILGGIESLHVESFNEIYQPGDAFGNRIARNQQHLLKEESYFNQVIDPAAGSYYIENLTHELIEKSWALFLQVQDAGGFIAAARSGFIQDAIEATAQKRDRMIAERKEIMLGTNQYPNFNEILSEELLADLLQEVEVDSNDLEIRPLKPYRGAMAFEALRYKVDQKSNVSVRPKAFMLTMGNLAMRRARAQFASNFFACAGIETVDNNGFTSIEEAAAAFFQSGAEIAVLCSSDDEYAELAPGLQQLISGKGILVIAGAPACMEDLQQAGINHFIHVKVNVLEELKRYVNELNIR